MDGGKSVTTAKVLTLVGFLVLLCSTYYLRYQVLELNRIRFSAGNVRADDRVKEMKATYPVRTAEYELQMKHYQTQMKQYREILELFQTDYDEYVRRVKVAPLKLPRRPGKPRSPELSDQLVKINASFRAQQYHYFRSTSVLTWVACVAALVLVGGLLYLLMFDTQGQRLFYVVILVLSFVFMIGPSFHSILTAVVGFLRPPPVF